MSPIQHPEHNPFKVANSVLTITAKRNPGLADVGGASWLGGILVSNPAKGLTWRFGYFEWRARMSGVGRGMFPALWMFSNHAWETRADGKQSAELDLFEVFGNPTGKPWASTAHLKPTPGTTLNVGSWDEDTTGWHRYGLWWTPDRITLYRDGVQRAEINGADAAWFATANLGLRMNVAVDPNFLAADSPSRSTSSDPAPGAVISMDVDYVRVYSRRPDNLPTGSADPLTA